MYLNMNDVGRPFRDNEEVLQEYQILMDHIFDYALDEEIGTDDFDLAAEALPDPSLDDAHEQIGEIMDWIDGREVVSPDDISIIALLRKLKLGRKEKLLFWLLLMPTLSGSCYRGYRKYLQLRNESKYRSNRNYFGRIMRKDAQ